jgi:hypothetical protein
VERGEVSNIVLALFASSIPSSRSRLLLITSVNSSPDHIRADFSHRFLTGSRQARDSRESIKARIKAQDSLDSMVSHDAQMHSIAITRT